MPDSAAKIFALLQPFVDKDWVLLRDIDKIQAKLDEFILIQNEEDLIACAGLKTYTNNYGEIYALAIDKKHQNQGYSKQLLDDVIKSAQQQNLSHIFAVSKYQQSWFLKYGFSSCSLFEIPPERQRDFNNKRNSSIFIKKI